MLSIKRRSLPVSSRQDLIHVSGGDLVMGSDGFYPEESPITRVVIDDLRI